jgi:D-alanine-D-alanine ligase
MVVSTIAVDNKEVTSDDLSEPPSRCPGLRHIVVIYNTGDRLGRGEEREAISNQETVETAHAVALALMGNGFSVALAAVSSEQDVETAVRGHNPLTTLVFNLCEELGGTSFGESKVPRVLERLGFTYTGNRPDSLSACLDKGFTKRQLLAHGIPTAPYQVFRSPSDPLRLPLPVIVKPVAEDASLGILRDSVVATKAALRTQVERVLEMYRQPALVEMFLDGREFNISLWGNGVTTVLPVSEIDYSRLDRSIPPLMNFDAKWNPDTPEYQTCPVLCPAPVETDTASLIRDIALRSFTTMGCRDYARVDIREKDGKLFVLEVNPNPCLAMDSGFSLAARAAGYDYPALLSRIVEWAWMRHLYR